MNTRRNAQGGTITLWMLGLVIVLFAVGGISLDLWNVFGDRRELVALADAAASAGASGIDEALFRETGEIHLDPSRARERVLAALEEAPHGGHVDSVEISITNDEVRVDLSRNTELTLLGVLSPGEEVRVEAHATAAPFESGA